MTTPDITGLCERLRDRAAFCKDCGGVTTYDEGDSALDNEAADLIERLDAMLAASPQGESSSADAEPVPRYELHPTGSGGSSDVLTYRVTEGVKP
jgi:hypothetical protein